MSLFRASTDRPRYVALLDIGSASVTASIAYSLPGEELTILWSTQERILLKHLKSRGETGKQIMSAFTNVILELGQTGAASMREHHPYATIDTMQVSIAAPWSYTITKQVHYKKEAPFSFSDRLYHELLDSLENVVAEELHEHEVSDHLGLTVVSRTVTGLRANGYPIDRPQNQTTTDLQIGLSNTVIQNYLNDMIVDGHNKIFPQAEPRVISFVLMLYYVLRDIHPEMKEYCLINQTMEATELGIVRDGQMLYSTHEPYGTVTLARDLAEIFGVSIEEVYGCIQTKQFATRYQALSQAKQAAVDEVLSAYEHTVKELVSQTGDAFTIPKTIYIHTASCTYSFLAPHIENGAKSATGLHHMVHNVDENVLRTATGLQRTRAEQSCVELVSAYFFHKDRHLARFITE